MEENLKAPVLNNIVIYMKFHMSFPHLLLQKKWCCKKEKQDLVGNGTSDIKLEETFKEIMG